MSSGMEKVKFVIASTINDEYVIVNAPEHLLEYDILEGCFCCDNSFTNKELIPKEKGIYELECEYCWDDRRSYFYEDSDPDWEFRIVRVNPIYQVKNN